MQITIRPDPDCIELIKSSRSFKDCAVGFLKSLGVNDDEAKIFDSTHNIKLNDKEPPNAFIFNMTCFLPEELFKINEWTFKITRREFYDSFDILGFSICCVIKNKTKIKILPKNLINLYCGNFEVEKFPEDILGSHDFPKLKSLSFEYCKKLKNMNFLGILYNLQSLDLGYCQSLKDISNLSGLINLQSLNLSGCESINSLAGIAGLLKLKSLNLSNCNSINNISEISSLKNLKSLNLNSCDSLANIRPLYSLSNLRLLNLSLCKSLKSIEGIKNLIKLQDLNLSWCESVSEFEELTFLSNLQFLSLKNCKLLKDACFLKELENLSFLNLSHCKSLKTLKGFEKLINLTSLDLSSCYLLEDLIDLSELIHCKSIYLHGCEALTNIKGLSGLINLNTLDLSYCKALEDATGLAGLINLQSLNLKECRSLTNINFISKMSNLKSIDLRGCRLISDLHCLKGLNFLENLDLRECKLITDVAPIRELVRLKYLNLGNCYLLEEANALSELKELESLDLNGCESLKNYNFLSGLYNLKSLSLSGSSIKSLEILEGLVSLTSVDFSSCEFLTDIDSLSTLPNLKSLNLEYCKRIQNYSSLKNCLSLEELLENKMHPVEFAELLCYLAIHRKDISFISKNSTLWLEELKHGLNEMHPMSNDLACCLAKGILLAELEDVGIIFHEILLGVHSVKIRPWKIWFSGVLEKFNWNTFIILSESKSLSLLTTGAIGGISFCLPTLDGEEGQVAWSKKWLHEIHSLHKNNPAFLRPAAAEWCLALKRLGEDQLLTEWIEKFTDPSDPSALDPINKVFSDYTRKLNDRESTLEYALKINDPKLRDESILNLAHQFLIEREITKAGNLLFLLTEIESRTKLAISLADDAGYLKNDENAHRLLAACGDDPKSIANIFEKLQIANPNSEILKITHEKLRINNSFNLSDEIITRELVQLLSKLSNISESGFIDEASKTIKLLLKNKPNIIK